MIVHLFDGTYELYRAFFGPPGHTCRDGREVGAARGLLRSFSAFVRKVRPTHVGIAFDHVIESFRNSLFDGYKTGDGVPPELFSQFELAERVAAAVGFAVWPMIDFEADDALATAAAHLARDPAVTQVRITAIDKDLAQCVEGARVVCWDRFRDLVLDEDGVRAKFGVPPAAIADLLALIGDDADGVPGVPRWGAKSAAAVLAEYRNLESIPHDAATWRVKVRGAESLAACLREHAENARLYKTLTTLRRDVPIDASRDALALRPVDASVLRALGDELELPTDEVDKLLTSLAP